MTSLVESSMFTTVLVANRGEIACRVIRTLRALGIRSVAVYSEPDAGARHVREADVALCIGPGAASESYLCIPAIVAACQESGAQAVHPGYGFLSENLAFAQALAEANITFIGPNVEALNVMGDKIRSKNHVARAGVPVVPGISMPGLTDSDLISAATDIGFPILIKPSAGGGGKGMHAVSQPEELPATLATARRVAASSFGDDTLFLERLVSTPRHIEVQILGDNHGNVIHLGERECSLQRRHQKVIEEAPSPLLGFLNDDGATRARIGAAACAAAASVNYTGAGTVEFLVSNENPEEFFFMEMNTRLQVEHPVTEMVVRVNGEPIDLVEWQLRIAAGERLTIAQADVELSGHAIEARVYSENPAQGFLPSVGMVSVLDESVAAQTGVRVDSSLIAGLEISANYDPMLAKVIAWGADRTQALTRLDEALRDYVVLGVPTNVEYLRMLLADPDVQAGRLDTNLIERKLPEFTFRELDAGDYAAAVAARHSLGCFPTDGRGRPYGLLDAASGNADPAPLTGAGLWGRDAASRNAGPAPLASASPYGLLDAASGNADPSPLPGTGGAASPWLRTDGWRLGEFAPWRVVCAGLGRTAVVTVSGRGGSGVVLVNEVGVVTEHQGHFGHESASSMTLLWDGEERRYRVATAGNSVILGCEGWSAPVQILSRDEATARMLEGLEREDQAADPDVRSPMPGTVTVVNVKAGDQVEAGTILLAVEAMKMEHQLIAAISGTVHLSVKVGSLVKADQVVATIQVKNSEGI